jgi:hypothetical protein
MTGLLVWVEEDGHGKSKALATAQVRRPQVLRLAVRKVRERLAQDDKNLAG